MIHREKLSSNDRLNNWLFIANVAVAYKPEPFGFMKLQVIKYALALALIYKPYALDVGKNPG